MSNLSVDVGSILTAIQHCILQIREENRAAKEKEEQARLVVYWGLSLHPALDAMKPPSAEFGDLDWYTDLMKPSWKSFGKLIKNNVHFNELSRHGRQGTRARIMLLLCWVIGHRLPEDRIRVMLSTALDDALQETRRIHSGSDTIRNGAQEALDAMKDLHSCKKVIGDLARMIKTKLPLPPRNDPFYEEFSSHDEDSIIPRDQLWAYSLPEERIYEFDVKKQPHLLFTQQSQPQRILIPQTKLSLLAIQWASGNFGLGKKVYKVEEIDEDAFWNADPPINSTATQ